MKKLFEFLFSGCWHKWEYKELPTDITEFNEKMGKQMKVCSGYTQEWRCSKCHKLKLKVVY